MKHLSLISRIFVCIFSLTLFLPCLSACASSPLDLSEFESVITADVADGFPGAQLAVIKDGELIYSGAWGYVDPYLSDSSANPDKSPVSPDTLFDIGGNTSVFVAAYCLQHLVATGKVSYDTRLVDILGEEFVSGTLDYRDTIYKADLPDYETMLSWKAGLTLENVLRYQSGFPVSLRLHGETFDFRTNDYNSSLKNPFYNVSGTKAEAYEKLCLAPLVCEPGQVTTVTDTDYILLTFVIEELTGQSLDEYFANTFSEPLGLSHLVFNPLKNGFAPQDCAATELTGNTRGDFITFPHVRTSVVQGEVHDEMSFYSMEGVSGHAGLFANATDLARLAYLMIDDQDLFSPEVISTATSPNSDNADYGMGWSRRVALDDNLWLFGDYASVESFGSVSFTHCSVSIDPTNSLVIVYLTNSISSPIGFTDPSDQSVETLKFLGNDYASAKFNAPMDAIYSALGLT